MGFQRSRFIHILGHFTRLSARSVVYLPWGLFETDLQCLIITMVSVQVNKILKLVCTPSHKRRSSRVINVQFHNSKSLWNLPLALVEVLRKLAKFMVNFSLELIDHQMYSITLSQDIIDRIVRKLNWMGCPRPILGLKYR